MKDSEMLDILLVEDNPGDARLIEVYLEEGYGRNFRLTVADRLEKGISLVSKRQFDIAILDLSLPDSSGIETFNRLYSEAPELPIVVLTGLNDEIFGINAVKVGAQDFLVKSQLDSNMLKRSISYGIERQQLYKELTERTHKLEQSEKRLKEAQRVAHLGSWEWDISNNMVSCSDELYTIYNINPAGFRGTLDDFLESVHPADRDNIKIAFRNARQNNKSFAFEHRVIRPDGKIRNIYGRADIISDDEGKSIRMIGTCQDVTERKREKELEKLAMGVTTSFNAVTISDRDGNIEWINQGFTNLSGYTLEEMQNQSPGKDKKNKNSCIVQRLAYIKKVIKEKAPLTFECKSLTKDGKEYWVITTLTPMLDSKGEVDKIIGIESDITLRKKIEEELRLAHKAAEDNLQKAKKALRELRIAKQQVEDTARAKEKFLANMSHEIRTPMNGIIGLTNILLKTQLDPEQREYLNAIKNSGETLVVVINDILDISKIEAGKMTFESIPFRISEVCNSVIELLYPKAKEKSVEMIKHIEEDVPQVLIGDPVRINQIIMNLMSNAVKFTKKGEIYLKVALKEETDDTATIKIAVQDTGRGIPKNKLRTIFQDFTQVSAEISRKYGGTGLGLAITKKLVELHEGSIEVNSQVGVGSSFTVTIRLKKCKDESQLAELAKADSTLQEHDEQINADVLVVEDNEVNQMLAEKLLTDWGCRVDLAENGKIAINKLNKNNYDLILMDIKMPVMDGYEATRYIREKMSSPVCNIPILAATAHAATWEAEKCIKAGMNGYISKPFNINELSEKIIRLTAGRTSGSSRGSSSVYRHKDAPKKGNGHKTGNGKSGGNGKAPREKGTKQSNASDNKKYTDLSYLRSISRGSSEFITRMINTFINQASSDIEKLKAHLASRDWESMSFTAHKMKPSFHFIGINDLKETIINLEKKARERKDLDSVPGLVEQIDRIFKKSLKELNAELENLRKGSNA